MSITASAPPREGDRIATKLSSDQPLLNQTEQHESSGGVVIMLAAMCVRKTGGDNVSTVSQVGSKESIVTTGTAGTTRKKHKTLKNIVVGRKIGHQSTKDKESVKESSREEDRPGLPKIEDDDDGHLIYKKGDRLLNCK